MIWSGSGEQDSTALLDTIQPGLEINLSLPGAVSDSTVRSLCQFISLPQLKMVIPALVTGDTCRWKMISRANGGSHRDTVGLAYTDRYWQSLAGAEPGFSQGGGAKNFPRYSGQYGAKNHLNVSYLPCRRRPQSSHIAKS